MTTMTRKGWNSAPTVTEEEARALTEEIRAAVEGVWVLLVRAHETKAWKALGYERWADYISGEFHKGRQWSYQLLDQAIVITEIEVASGVYADAYISQQVAREIKPLLPEVTEQIRARLERGDEPEAAVKETIATAREAAAKPPPINKPGIMVTKGNAPDVAFQKAMDALDVTRVVLRQIALDSLPADAPAERWIKEIDETLKALRAMRIQLRSRYGIT